VSDMLEFTTKPKDDAPADGDGDAPAGPPPFRCKLDGVELVGSVRPKDAIVAQLAPVQNRRTPTGMKVHLALNFLGDVLDPASRVYVESRLTDPADPLDAEDVLPIIHAVADHWKAVADAEKAAKKAAGRR
jgi:hypothetical protein